MRDSRKKLVESSAESKSSSPTTSMPSTNSTSKAPTASSSTAMTDSGITHTIPNNSVVTVTMHTTITTKRPSPDSLPTDATLASDATSTLDASSDPATTAIATGAASTESGVAGTDGGVKMSSGAIIGAAVGGAVLIAILVVVFIVMRRKKKGDEADDVNEGDHRVDEQLAGEKHYSQPLSTHTTGTQGSGDPFAPFGGRADQPEDPYRPHSGAFEMDGNSAGPVELPVTGNTRSSASSTAAAPAKKAISRLDPVQETAATDPRANLNCMAAENGKPAYINHWNMYRNLGSS